MIAQLFARLLPAETSLPAAVPAGVHVLRGRLIPTFAGLLSGMGQPAAAVTLGDVIIVHPHVPLTPRLLRHELEHVRQWRAHSLSFPVRYAWSHLRYGYHDNPYEVEARAAEQCRPEPGGEV